MIDQPLAAKLAREGFELWESGDLEQARARYAKALEVADPNHWALPEYHGEFAAVLESLGKSTEAESHLRKAVEVELAHGESEDSPAVLVGRYFLADHLLRHGAPERALDSLAPSLISAPSTMHRLPRRKQNSPNDSLKFLGFPVAPLANPPLQGTPCRPCRQVPSGLRPPVAPELAR